jgi:hypothetical protein
MMEYNIIFYEDDKEKNKELTDYLDKNLKEIITKCNIYFNFIIATENDKDKLNKDGILLLPALLPKNAKPVLGLKNIYKYINYCINNPQPKRPKTEEEILQEFMNKEIQDGVSKVKDGNKKKLIIKDDENTDEFSNDNINRKIQNEQRKRGLGPNDNSSINSNMDELYTPNRPNNLSENFSVEDDEDENNNSRHDTGTRNNNSNSNTKNDPLNVFNNMQSNNGSQDDDMFKSLLEKLDDE